ncbi:hypothetical protein KBD61_04255 [Patescibacteria group bacterium]|nr:hypothetical protein [Patescibacteria group bacterium]MBP9710207.1 hypothetical protein [Patescibacteria group bacterium]
MLFDIMGAIHRWSAPKTKEEPEVAPTDPSKDRKSVPPTPKAPKKFVNPYEPNSRYRHLKEEDGSWRKVSDDKDWTPWEPPAESNKEKRARLEYEDIVEQVAFLEDLANRPTPVYQQQAWDDGWRKVKGLLPIQSQELEDRLLACHPVWERVEVALERVRQLRAENHVLHVEELEDALKSAQVITQVVIGRTRINGGGAHLTKTRQRFEYYTKRIQEEKRIGEALDKKPEVSSYKKKPFEIYDRDTKVRTILHSTQTPILETVSENKQARRQKEAAKVDKKRIVEELRVTTFELERELGSTRSRDEVRVAMERIQMGTFRVGVVSRTRDWFSSRLGKLAGHTDHKTLQELVEKHGNLTKTLEKIEEVLGSEE